MWTLVFGHHEDRTRRTATPQRARLQGAFAKSGNASRMTDRRVVLRAPAVMRPREPYLHRPIQAISWSLIESVTIIRTESTVQKENCQ
jgi:hypothetical protein